jgi:hypothetical protein
MPKTRPPYPPEFRRQMVDLVRAGRDPDDLAKEFEPTAQSIRYWSIRISSDVVSPMGFCKPCREALFPLSASVWRCM